MPHSTTTKLFIRFLPFFIFLIFFKFGAGLHYTVSAPFGEKILPIWIIGLIMGGAAFAQLLFDVPAGYIMDKYGYRRFLKIGTVFFLVAAACFMYGLTTTTYLVSTTISVLGWVFFGPGINAYILSHTPQGYAGRFIALKDVFSSLGIVFSSAVLPFVLHLSVPQVGYFIFVLLLISLTMLFLSPKDHVSVHLEKKIDTHHYYIKRTFITTSLRAITKLNPASSTLLLLGLSGSIFYGAIWFVVPLVIAHQANAGLLGVGLGIFDFAVVVLGFLLGNLADKFNRRTLVFFGLLLFSLSGMLLGFNFGWLFLLFGFLATSGDEMAGVSLWSWLHTLDKEHAHNGTISGIINLFQDLGWAIGPMLAGALYVKIGAEWTILLTSFPIFLTWIIYQFTVRTPLIDHLGGLIPRKPHRPRHKN